MSDLSVPAIEAIEERKKATILVISGDYEKLFAAFSIAISAAASNMDVAMFFSSGACAL